jgi:hypothetical protein
VERGRSRGERQEGREAGGERGRSRGERQVEGREAGRGERKVAEYLGRGRLNWSRVGEIRGSVIPNLVLISLYPSPSFQFILNNFKLILCSRRPLVCQSNNQQ